MIVALNIASAVAAFSAAIFWFLSANGKPPPMLMYWNAAPPDDPFYRAFAWGIRMNRIAAILSGVSALLVAIALFLQSHW